MNTMSPEEIMELKEDILEDLFEMVTEEIGGGESYLDVAEESRPLNNPQLTAVMIAHAKDEIRHAAENVALIDSMVGNLKDNPLKPLYSNVLKWHAKVKHKVDNFK